MRLTFAVAVATAACYGLATLPVRAFPQGSVNLIRIEGERVQPLPDITNALTPPASRDPVAPTDRAIAELQLSQASMDGTATPPAGTSGLTLPVNPGEAWRIC